MIENVFLLKFGKFQAFRLSEVVYIGLDVFFIHELRLHLSLRLILTKHFLLQGGGYQVHCLMFKALKVLEKYSTNLLKPENERPPSWRQIIITNDIFQQKVGFLMGAKSVFKLLGYKEEILGEDGKVVGLKFPDSQKRPNAEMVENIATDLCIAKFEVNLIVNETHPNLKMLFETGQIPPEYKLPDDSDDDNFEDAFSSLTEISSTQIPGSKYMPAMLDQSIPCAGEQVRNQDMYSEVTLYPPNEARFNNTLAATTSKQTSPSQPYLSYFDNSHQETRPVNDQASHYYDNSHQVTRPVSDHAGHYYDNSHQVTRPVSDHAGHYYDNSHQETRPVNDQASHYYDNSHQVTRPVSDQAGHYYDNSHQVTRPVSDPPRQGGHFADPGSEFVIPNIYSEDRQSVTSNIYSGYPRAQLSTGVVNSYERTPIPSIYSDVSYREMPKPTSGRYSLSQLRERELDRDLQGNLNGTVTKSRTNSVPNIGVSFVSTPSSDSYYDQRSNLQHQQQQYRNAFKMTPEVPELYRTGSSDVNALNQRNSDFRSKFNNTQGLFFLYLTKI